MKVLYGQAYRAPSLTELYQNSPIETSNRNLQPEEVETIELVFGKDFGSKTQTTLTYFHNTINNVIRGVLQPGPGTLQRVNEGRVTIHGMEWELATTLTEKLKIIANYTHIFSGMSDDAFQDSATLNASYKTGKWRFNINAIARNEMARVLPDQGSFYLLNARVNFNLKEHLSFGITANNLLDEDYVTYGAQLDPALYENKVPNRGREVRVGLTLSL